MTKKSSIVRKAVIPVAGLGTRMLPATKAIPKEMLPVVDKPLIQYVVKEAIAAGIKEIILVTHSSKNSIENHFDKSFELEATLEKRVKRQLLAEVQNICPKDVTIMHIRQGEAKGLGHAILCAHPLVGDAPFAVILPDVLIDEVKSNPQTDNLAVVGRYVLSDNIWSLLEKTPLGAGDEIQLTDAIAMLMEQEQVNAYRMKGISHDCGSKMGYMKANVIYGLRHKAIGTEFTQFIKEIASTLD